MAKLKSNNFKDTHGYSRVGSVLKGKEEKENLKKRQVRINSFTPAMNKQVAATLERNNDVPAAVKKGAILNTAGSEPGYQGDQRYKAKRRVRMARFRGGDS
jgi:hypothetical protein